MEDGSNGNYMFGDDFEFGQVLDRHWLCDPSLLLLLSKENLVWKCKRCFPTFVDGIPSKSVNED